MACMYNIIAEITEIPIIYFWESDRANKEFQATADMRVKFGLYSICNRIS